MQTLVLILLCATGIFKDAPQETAWKEFASAEGRFSALMPDEPKSNVIATKTLKGTLFTHTISSTDKNLNEYMVSWTEYQKDNKQPEATEKTFNRVRDALVEFKGGKLLDDSAINMEGHPARAITFATSDGRTVKVRFYFVKNRFYQVMVETRSEDKAAEAAERFLNSFKLLPGTLV